MNKKTADNILSENRSSAGVILALAGPTMLENFMGTAVQYVDTAMVGSLGTAATAAVGCTTTVNWLIGHTISAIGVGFLSFIAKAMGAGDEEKGGRASAQAVILSAVIGIFGTALTLALARFVPGWMKADETIRDTAAAYFAILYSALLFRTATIVFGTLLRAAGDTKTPMWVGIGMSLVNVVLNFLLIYDTRYVNIAGKSLLIYGAGMGVVGAAAASAVSFAVGGIAITAALWRHKRISPEGKSFAPDPEILSPCLRVALPNMLQRFCTSLGYVVFAVMINSLGEISTAAHTIANTVESAFYIPGFGMQAAIATLTGNCIGARAPERFRDLSRTAVRLEFLMMVVSGGMLFTFAPAMVSLFSKDAQVVALGGTVLKMVAVSEPLYGISIITEGMLQGAGLTKKAFIFSVICMWGIRIFGTWLCVSRGSMGLIAAWACMIANNMALLALLRIYWRRVSGKIFEN